MQEHHTESHLPHYRVRPRFKMVSPFTSQEIADKLRSGLERQQALCLGKVYATSARIFLPYAQQHYWSPQLSLTYEEEEEGVMLRGLYGPRPSIWTMFVFFYAVIGLGILIIGMVGLSYLSLGKPATILWWLPVLILVFLTLYLVAFFGQKMGRKQMIILHRFTEESLGLDLQ